MRTLTSRLTLFFSLLIIVSMAILGVTNFYFASQALRDAIESDAIRLADGSADRINEWLLARQSEMQVLANGPVIRSMDWNLAGGFITAVGNGNPDFALVWLARPDGSMNGSNGQSSNLADRDYFQQVIKTKAPVISDPVLSKTSGKWITAVAVPVKGPDGQLVGVVGASVNLDRVDQILAETKIGAGYAYLMQKGGMMVSHPDRTQVMNPDHSYLRTTNEELRRVAERMVAGEAGQGSYAYEGIKKSSFFAPVPSTGWSLAVTTNESEVMAPLSVLTKTSLLLGAGMAIIAAVMAWLISRSIARPLRTMAAISLQVSDGDLSQRMDYGGQDEIAELAANFNRMTEQLAATVGGLGSTTQEIKRASLLLTKAAQEAGEGSSQIAATMQELAAGSSDSAEQTQRGAELLEQLSQAIEQVTRTSQIASETSDRARHAVYQGGEAMAVQQKKIHENAQAAQTVAAAINQVVAQAQDVTAIVDLIRVVANQTNLLALNAAIEAARAGEAGRGFAVVADEVRKLAEQSNQEAEKISAIVSAMGNAIGVAVQQMTLAGKLVEEQNEAGQRTEGAFVAVRGAIEQIVVQIQEEAALAEEMAASADEVVHSIQTLAAHAEESAAGVQEVAATAEQQASTADSLSSLARQLEQQAARLSDEMGRFKL